MTISLPCVKGDSPQCGEMSRSVRGDGHRLGGGNAAGIDGGIVGRDTHIALFLSTLRIYNYEMLIYYE